MTWHRRCPPLLLWKLPVGTFTIIWSPDGQKHQTETYTRAHTRHRHHTHTGPVPEGRWASHCLHSERISHPEGSAAWWARGVSGSVSLPSEELVRVCTRPILAHTKTHGHNRKHTHTQPVCMNHAAFSCCQSAVYGPCLPVRIFIKRSTQLVKESTHRDWWVKSILLTV